MYYVFLVEKFQAFDNWIAEAADQTQAESLIVVFLNQLVQVVAEIER